MATLDEIFANAEASDETTTPSLDDIFEQHATKEATGAASTLAQRRWSKAKIGEEAAKRLAKLTGLSETDAQTSATTLREDLKSDWQDEVAAGRSAYKSKLPANEALQKLAATQPLPKAPQPTPPTPASIKLGGEEVPLKIQRAADIRKQAADWKKELTATYTQGDLRDALELIEPIPLSPEESKIVDTITNRFKGLRQSDVALERQKRLVFAGLAGLAPTPTGYVTPIGAEGEPTAMADIPAALAAAEALGAQTAAEREAALNTVSEMTGFPIGEIRAQLNTSADQAMLMSAGRSALPTATAIMAGSRTARGMAALSAFGAARPWLGGIHPGLQFVMTMAAGMTAAYATQYLQDKVTPEVVMDALNNARSEHPWPTFIGEAALGPSAFFKPSPTNLGRAVRTLYARGHRNPQEIANLINVGLGAVIGGGAETARQMAEGHMDIGRIIAEAGVNAVFSEPTRLAKKGLGIPSDWDMPMDAPTQATPSAEMREATRNLPARLPKSLEQQLADETARTQQRQIVAAVLEKNPKATYEELAEAIRTATEPPPGQVTPVNELLQGAEDLLTATAHNVSALMADRDRLTAAPGPSGLVEGPTTPPIPEGVVKSRLGKTYGLAADDVPGGVAEVRLIRVDEPPPRVVGKGKNRRTIPGKGKKTYVVARTDTGEVFRVGRDALVDAPPSPEIPLARHTEGTPYESEAGGTGSNVVGTEPPAWGRYRPAQTPGEAALDVRRSAAEVADESKAGVGRRVVLSEREGFAPAGAPFRGEIVFDENGVPMGILDPEGVAVDSQGRNYRPLDESVIAGHVNQLMGGEGGPVGRIITPVQYADELAAANPDLMKTGRFDSRGRRKPAPKAKKGEGGVVLGSLGGGTQDFMERLQLAFDHFKATRKNRFSKGDLEALARTHPEYLGTMAQGLGLSGRGTTTQLIKTILAAGEIDESGPILGSGLGGAQDVLRHLWSPAALVLRHLPPQLKADQLLPWMKRMAQKLGVALTQTEIDAAELDKFVRLHAKSGRVATAELETWLQDRVLRTSVTEASEKSVKEANERPPSPEIVAFRKENEQITSDLITDIEKALGTDNSNIPLVIAGLDYGDITTRSHAIRGLTSLINRMTEYVQDLAIQYDSWDTFDMDKAVKTAASDAITVAKDDMNFMLDRRSASPLFSIPDLDLILEDFGRKYLGYQMRFNAYEKTVPTVETLRFANMTHAWLPGGTNKREIVIYPMTHIPDESQSVTTHFYNNALGHARTTDRVTADGGRMLFGEEFQSDWMTRMTRWIAGGKAVQRRSELHTRFMDLTTPAIKELYATAASLFSGVENTRVQAAFKRVMQDSELSKWWRSILEAGEGRDSTWLKYQIINIMQDAIWARDRLAEHVANIVYQRAFDYLPGDVRRAMPPKVEKEIHTALKNKAKELLDPHISELRAITAELPGLQTKAEMKPSSEPPTHPLLPEWAPLLVKRFLRVAASEDFDSIGWTTGRQQQIRNNHAQVDDSWETRLYDKQLVDILNKFGKRFGVKVEEGRVLTSIKDPNWYKLQIRDLELKKAAQAEIDRLKRMMEEEIQKSETIHSLRLTPEMKLAIIEEGNPTFGWIYREGLKEAIADLHDAWGRVGKTLGSGLGGADEVTSALMRVAVLSAQDLWSRGVRNFQQWADAIYNALPEELRAKVTYTQLREIYNSPGMIAARKADQHTPPSTVPEGQGVGESADYHSYADGEHQYILKEDVYARTDAPRTLQTAGRFTHGIPFFALEKALQEGVPIGAGEEGLATFFGRLDQPGGYAQSATAIGGFGPLARTTPEFTPKKAIGRERFDTRAALIVEPKVEPYPPELGEPLGDFAERLPEHQEFWKNRTVASHAEVAELNERIRPAVLARLEELRQPTRRGRKELIALGETHRLGVSPDEIVAVVYDGNLSDIRKAMEQAGRFVPIYDSNGNLRISYELKKVGERVTRQFLKDNGLDAPSPPESPLVEPHAGFGSKNRTYTRDRAMDALHRLKRKLFRLNALVPLDTIDELMEFAGFVAEAFIRELNPHPPQPIHGALARFTAPSRGAFLLRMAEMLAKQGYVATPEQLAAFYDSPRVQFLLKGLSEPTGEMLSILERRAPRPRGVQKMMRREAMIATPEGELINAPEVGTRVFFSERETQQVVNLVKRLVDMDVSKRFGRRLRDVLLGRHMSKEAIGQLAMVIRMVGRDANGERVWGGQIRTGDIDIRDARYRNVTSGTQLDDGRIVVGPVVDDEGKLSRYKWRTVLAVTPERAREAYNALHRDHPDAATVFEAYDAWAEPPVISFNVQKPPFSRHVMKRYFEVRGLDPAEAAANLAAIETALGPAHGIPAQMHYIPEQLIRNPRTSEARVRNMLRLMTPSGRRRKSGASAWEVLKGEARDDLIKAIRSNQFQFGIEKPQHMLVKAIVGSLAVPHDAAEVTAGRYMRLTKKSYGEGSSWETFALRNARLWDEVGIDITAGSHMIPSRIAEVLAPLYRLESQSTNQRYQNLWNAFNQHAADFVGAVTVGLLYTGQAVAKNLVSGLIDLWAKIGRDLMLGVTESLDHITHYRQRRGEGYSLRGIWQPVMSDVNPALWLRAGADTLRENWFNTLPKRTPPLELLGSALYQEVARIGPVTAAIPSRALRYTFAVPDAGLKRLTYLMTVDASAAGAWRAAKAHGRTGGMTRTQFKRMWMQGYHPEMIKHFWRQMELAGASDYGSVPGKPDKFLSLKWLRENIWGRLILPFPVWAYKQFANTYFEYLGSYHRLILKGLFGGRLYKDSRVATELANAMITTIGLGVAYQAIDHFKRYDDENLPPEGIKESSLPSDVQISGRIRVPFTDDYWMRIADLPFVGPMAYVHDAMRGRLSPSDMPQVFMEMIGIGPLVMLAGTAYGWMNDYNKNQTYGSRLGTQLVNSIPLSRVILAWRGLESVDPHRRQTSRHDQTEFENFIASIQNAIPYLSRRLPVALSPRTKSPIPYPDNMKALSFLLWNAKPIDADERQFAINAAVLENLKQSKRELDMDLLRQAYERMAEAGDKVISKDPLVSEVTMARLLDQTQFEADREATVTQIYLEHAYLNGVRDPVALGDLLTKHLEQYKDDNVTARAAQAGIYTLQRLRDFEEHGFVYQVWDSLPPRIKEKTVDAMIKSMERWNKINKKSLISESDLRHLAQPYNPKKQLAPDPEWQKSTAEDLANNTAIQYGVSPALVNAIIAVESGSNPAAISSKGAKGLMQLMPGTAKAYGVTDPHDPEQNVAAGVQYLIYLLKRYDNDVELALAAYNAGPTAVDKAGGIPNYPETQAYVKKVITKMNEIIRMEEYDAE